MSLSEAILVVPEGENKIDFQNRLLTWFEQAKRNFPWRSQADPYAILIAEKLLQQTAARDVVIKAYEQLLHRYPAPQHLAEAKISDLKEIIQPLGLSYRANELKVMAQELVTRYSGKIPRSLKELLSLPGVGDYSARAVLSFAFEEDVPIVDTNVARFLYRLCGIPGSLPANPARKRSLIHLAEILIPKGQSKQFNLAILDLCAQICKPTTPLCSECPVQRHCVYGTKGGNV